MEEDVKGIIRIVEWGAEIFPFPPYFLSFFFLTMSLNGGTTEMKNYNELLSDFNVKDLGISCSVLFINYILSNDQN